MLSGVIQSQGVGNTVETSETNFISDSAEIDIRDTGTAGTGAGGTLILGSNDDTVMVDTDRLGVVKFVGAEDTGGTMTTGAKIEAVADATWSASENGASLNFYTTDGDAAQTNRLTISAAGPVGISTETGTATDAVIYLGEDGDNNTGATIRYQTSGDTLAFRCAHESDNHLTIGADGQVGIGTDGPEASLHVKGNIHGATLAILESTGTNTDDEAPELVLYRNANLTDDGDIGTIRFRGLDSGGATTDYARIEAEIVDETDSEEDGKLRFFTLKAGSEDESLTINSGNVGIGITAPTSLLHVKGAGIQAITIESTDQSCELVIQSGAVETKNSVIRFASGGDSDGRIYYDHHETPANQKMFFKTGDALVNAMVLDGAGNVGIGTTEPQSTLSLKSDAVIEFEGSTGQDGRARIRHFQGSWDSSSSQTYDVALGDDSEAYFATAYEAIVTIRNSGSANAMAWGIYGFSRNGAMDATDTIWGSESYTCTDPVFVDTGSANVLRISAHVNAGATGFTVLLREVQVS